MSDSVFRPISVSERQLFKRCRRAWDISASSRQNLQPARPPAIHNMVGTLVHTGLEANKKAKSYFERQMYPLAVADKVAEMKAEYAEIIKQLIGSTLFLETPEIEASFDSVHREAIALLDHYFDAYSLQPLADHGLQYIGGEVKFTLHIPNSSGFLTGVIDGIAENIETGEIWGVEHKTYKRRLSHEFITMHDQILVYMWALKEMFPGRTIGGFIYDGIAKKTRKEPTINKNGTISKKLNNVTASWFWETVRNIQQENNETYQATFNALVEMDKGLINRFFTRVLVPYRSVAIKQTIANLVPEFEDMRKPDIALYPNFSPLGCTDCYVRDLCRVMQLGEDVELYKRMNYVTRISKHTETDDLIDVPEDIESEDE